MKRKIAFMLILSLLISSINFTTLADVTGQDTFMVEYETWLDDQGNPEGVVRYAKGSGAIASPSAATVVEPRENVTIDSNEYRFLLEPPTKDVGSKLNILTPDGFELDHIEIGDSKEVGVNEITQVDAGRFQYTLMDEDVAQDGDWENIKIKVFIKPEGTGPVFPVDVEEEILRQWYVFGDWDCDGDMTISDMSVGIAQQIYYTVFDTNSDLQEKYGITSWDDVDLNLTVGATGEKEQIELYNPENEDRENPVLEEHEYILTLKEEGQPDLEITGKAWMFDVINPAEIENSRNYVVMYATKGTQTVSLLVDTAHDLRVDLGTGETFDPQNKDDHNGVYVLHGDYDVDLSEDLRAVGIHGNGAELDFLQSSEEDVNFCQYQGRNEVLVNQAHMYGTTEQKAVDAEGNFALPVIFNSFAFIQSDARCVEIYAGGAMDKTPSWDFGYSKVGSTNGSNVIEVKNYYGNENIVLSGVVNTNSKIVEVNPVNAPAEAFEIEPTTIFGPDMVNVRFLSDFYDNIEFEIVFEDGTKGSIKCHRVGIDIKEGINNEGIEGEKCLFHGNANGPLYTPEAEGNKVIYATYYYPEKGEFDVDLFVTLTYADGAVERMLIENDEDLNMDWHHEEDNNKYVEGSLLETNDCQSSDYIIYDGDASEAPVQVEAIAVKRGSDNSNFAGTVLGSGNGVLWVAD
ncbi:MAG: hypothetical protein Q4B67_03200 [Eubacteriales bacterium]|nr:hypothetical protein [Eubacteriales bacterium]